MAKFIIQCTVLISLSLATMYYFYQIHTPYQYHVNKFTDIDTTYQIINLGTSHGWAFDYQYYNLSGTHFNREGNTLYYDLQNYKYLKPHLQDSAIIILPISFFSFGLDENRTDRGEGGPFVNEFYSYLPRHDIYNYSTSKKSTLVIDRCQDNFNNIIKKWQKNLTAAKKKSSPKPKAPKPHSTPNDTIKKPAIDSSLIRAKHLKSIQKHAKIRREQALRIGVYTKPEKNINYLSTLIEDAQKMGYKPLLTTTPFHVEYLKGFESEWLNSHFYTHLLAISKKYNVPYLDYSNDKRISPKDELFHDADHLSKEGVILFNQIFLQDLKNLKFIQE